MGIAIFVIFTIVAVLCFLEYHITEQDKKKLYWGTAILLVLLAGFREVGIDPDSGNYEYAFHHYDDDRLSGAIEYSYFIISAILRAMVEDVHILFVFYALFGVMLKFIAFRKLSELWFLPVLVYLSFIYELHEITQIRTGVMSGLFLLAIPAMAERKWTQAILLLALGTFFHVSALILFPLLLLSNKDMSPKRRMLWMMAIPCSYVIYFLGSNLMVHIPIPYIENKIANYEQNKDVIESSLNVFSPLHLFTILIYGYLMYFYDTIKEHNKYLSLQLKIFTLSIVAFTAFAFLPVLANRVSYLLRIVTIILFGNIYYTILPKRAGIVAVLLVAAVYMVYTYSYIFGIKIL